MSYLIVRLKNWLQWAAKVLHPRCLGPVAWAKIPVSIHNTFGRNITQTNIIPDSQIKTGQESKVMAITRRDNQVLITISSFDMWGKSGFLSEVFVPFGNLGISVDLIATSQYAVSMTLDHIPGGLDGMQFKNLLKSLKKKGDVSLELDCTVVSIVGRKLRSILHKMNHAFREFEHFNILLLSESTEDLNMSFALNNVSSQTIDELIIRLHRALLENQEFNSNPKTTGKLEKAYHNQTSEMISKKVDEYCSTPSPVEITQPSDYHHHHIFPTEKFLTGEFPEKYGKLPTPFCITSIISIENIASSLIVYCLSWSNDPAIVTSIYRKNKNVIFICRSLNEILQVCSMVGPQINAYTLNSLSIQEKKNLLPTTVRLHTTNIPNDIIMRSYTLLSKTRILVSSIFHRTQHGNVTLDAWFKPHISNSSVKILNGFNTDDKKVFAYSPFEDTPDFLFPINKNQLSFQENNIHVLLTCIPTPCFSLYTRKSVSEYIYY